MKLNVQNADVVRLADDDEKLADASKTEAVRMMQWLDAEVWSAVAPATLERALSREEEEALLGYGEAGA